jgi:methanogenic corrinoid protein MtbC1
MIKNDLTEAMASLDEAMLLRSAEALAKEGCRYSEAVTLLNAGIKKVGDLFEKGDYFIADLIVSGMLYRSAISYFAPKFNYNTDDPIGKVVIGVVEDDIHDIGKDIVTSILLAEKFEVIDLGVDVKPIKFVHAIKTYKPDILLLSGTMGFSRAAMQRTIEEIKNAGLRENVAILAGGGCVNSALCEQIGADAAATDPMFASKFCSAVLADRVK